MWCRTERCSKELASCTSPDQVGKELKELQQFCSNLSPSTKTHYHHLNEWSDVVYEFIRKRLYAEGFINGDKKSNDEIPEVRFWWELYGLLGSVIWSPKLKGEFVANHHSSANARNQAFIGELDDILDSVET